MQPEKCQNFPACFLIPKKQYIGCKHGKKSQFHGCILFFYILDLPFDDIITIMLSYAAALTIVMTFILQKGADVKVKNKNLKILIAVLAILLAVSLTALGGMLLIGHFSHSDPATVAVPGNIITPEGSDVASINTDLPSTVLSDSKSDETNDTAAPPDSSDTAQTVTEVVPTSAVKASALSLHTKQPEENKPFHVTNMFPGDNEIQYFRIKVSYKGDIVVRYHADIRPGYEKLAEVLKVRIRLLGSDGFLYDGRMRDMPQSLNHALYTTQSTESELYYEITAYLDTSVGNEYMDKDLIADFRWWVEETDRLDSPQTGESKLVYLWICLAAGSLLCLLILIGKRRKEAADEE